MKLGVARHGPCAPCAVQLGKYDIFTMTGTPVRDTRNETEWSVARTSLTATCGSDRLGTASVAGSFGFGASRDVIRGCTFFQLEGPSATSGGSSGERSRAPAGVRVGASHHSTATLSRQSLPETPRSTTGSTVSPSTSGASRTSYTVHPNGAPLVADGPLKLEKGTTPDDVL